MFATIISRALFYYAFHAGAADAEDVAQEVIVNLLRRRPYIRKNARGYLRSVVYNEVCSQWRRSKGTQPLPEEIDTLKVPHRENDDAWEAVDRLMAEVPDLLWWLVDYSEGEKPHAMMDRVRAHRRRQKLREVLAT